MTTPPSDNSIPAATGDPAATGVPAASGIPAASVDQPPQEHPTSHRSWSMDALLLLKRWRRFIAVNVLVVTGAAIVISFLLPKTYMTSTTLMPPKNSSPMNLLGLSSSGFMRQLNPMSILSGSLSPNLYTFVAVLKSRSMLLRVVEKFDLRSVYGSTYLDDAISTLKGNMDFTVDEEGTITITVLDRDPDRVYRMATFFVTLLDSLNRDLSLREATSSRLFLETRVQQNLDDMRQAEVNLKEFQEKSGGLALSGEATASVDAAAELYAQKTMKELEVGYLSRVLGNDNPTLQAARLQLAELSDQLRSYPDRGLQFFRLYREFTLQQKLYETLLPMYEQAKLEERRNTPTLLVLDEATVPVRPALPRKKIIVLVAFLVSLLLSIGVALLIEGMRKHAADDPERYGELARLFRHRGARPPRSRS